MNPSQTKRDVGECPKCGQLNSRMASRCHACGATLPWPQMKQTSAQLEDRERWAGFIALLALGLLACSLIFPVVQSFSSAYLPPSERPAEEFGFGGQRLHVVDPFGAAFITILCLGAAGFLALKWWRGFYLLGPSAMLVMWLSMQRLARLTGASQQSSVYFDFPGATSFWPLFILGAILMLAPALLAASPSFSKLQTKTSPMARNAAPSRQKATPSVNVSELAVRGAACFAAFVLCSMCWPLGFFAWKHFDNEDSYVAPFALLGVGLGFVLSIGRFLLLIARAGGA